MGEQVRVLPWDGSMLGDPVNFDHGFSVYSVDWYPSSLRLVIGGDQSFLDGNSIRGLDFDPDAGTLTSFFDKDHGSSVRSVDTVNVEPCVTAFCSDVQMTQDLEVCGSVRIKGDLVVDGSCDCVGTGGGAVDLSCIDQDVSIQPDFKLLTNEINPVIIDSDGNCVEDEDGVTNFSGNAQVCGDLKIKGKLAGANPTVLIGGQLAPEGDIDVREVDGDTGETIDTINWLILPNIDGSDIQVLSVAWSPCKRYNAQAVSSPEVSTSELIVYDTQANTVVDSVGFGTQIINSIAWSPNSRFIVTGSEGLDGTTELDVFEFDGSSLSFVTGEDFATQTIKAVDWSVDGTHIAVGAAGMADPDELYVYAFDGTDLSFIDSIQYGTQSINSVRWSADGRFIATGNNTVFNEIDIVEFDGASIFFKVNFEVSPDQEVRSVDWTILDGECFVAVGLSDINGQPTVRVYNYDGDVTLTQVASDPLLDASVTSVSWYRDGRHLAVGSDTAGDGNNVRAYTFDGSSLVQDWAIDHGNDVASVDVTACPVCVGTDLAIQPGYKLLTNDIDPVTKEGCPDPTGTTRFSGNVEICGDLTVKGESPGNGGEVDLSCIDQDISIQPGFQLNVNRICPVDSDCFEDENGCLELCGDRVIIPGTLLVKEFGSFTCRSPERGEVEEQPIRFASTVEMSSGLAVDGVLLSNGQDIGNMVHGMVDTLQALSLRVEELEELLKNGV